ncbi:MAG: TetR/AcrR family transcriptional regulator [Roseiarcus sp.]
MDVSDVELVAPVHDGVKRQQILDGARTVFLSDGFDGASMNDIARVAGVSKGTLYVYFESKEQLFEALIRHDKEQQPERLALSSPPQDTDARQFLGLYGRRLVAIMTKPEMIAQVRMVIAATGKFPRIGQAFYEAGPCYGVRVLSGHLKTLVDRGELEIDDIEVAALQFLEMSKAGLLNRVLFGAAERLAPEEIGARVDKAVDVFLEAYGARRRQARLFPTPGAGNPANPSL